jgi:alkylated DNA repair dioxygenase AlkB
MNSFHPAPEIRPRLFENDSFPAGFVYRAAVTSADEERAIVAKLSELPFSPFEFHGFLGNRRTISFGWRYDFGGRVLRRSEPLPDFLLDLREKAGALASVEADRFEQVLVNEYGTGAGIGWHRDKALFDDVVAFSFVAPGLLRFRRKQVDRWDRRSLAIEPRSAYLLRGPARTEWQHSIPPHKSLRYSVTFRNFVRSHRCLLDSAV